MNFIVARSIVVLVNRYLAVCGTDWSEEFNYFVSNVILAKHKKLLKDEFTSFLNHVTFGNASFRKSISTDTEHRRNLSWFSSLKSKA